MQTQTPSQHPAAPQPEAYADLKWRIEVALQDCAGDDARSVRVTVDGSIVLLSGTVPSWAVREAVREAAWDALGVGRVIDHLVVAY